MSPEYREKLVELQEAMNELQVLKQIGGTEKLQKLQEKRIFSLHQEIQKMNRNVQLSPVDAILPFKCRTCPEKTSDEERLQCYDENYETCKRPDSSLTPIKMSIIKLSMLFISILLVLFLFLLFTNIFMKYSTNLWIIFIGSFSFTTIITYLFKKPMSQILQKID